MASSISPEPAPPLPRESRLDTLAAQVAAIDELIGLAQQRLQIFDVDLSEGGWNTAARANLVAQFMRRAASGRIELIAHDLRWFETSCPRLLALLATYAHAITIYRTGAEAKGAVDPLMIVDGRHYLHRFHVDHPRATLAIEQPQLARPLITRFEQIWATGEVGLGASVLGL
jgi:hypothetical protein